MRRASDKILFITSSRRQLNDRNSGVEHSPSILPPSRPVADHPLDPPPTSGFAILLGDNSEMATDRGSWRGNTPTRNSRAGFLLPPHPTFYAASFSRARKGSRSYLTCLILPVGECSARGCGSRRHPCGQYNGNNNGIV